ncbi:MAG: signal peptidase II [Pseudomonadota bacterium]
MRRFIAWLSVAVLVIAADQATKWAIITWVPEYSQIPINSFFNLTHLQNEGAAFSMFADAGGWQVWFFSIVAGTVSAAIIYWLWTIRLDGPIVLSAGLALVLGGAIGNLIDRLSLGHVTDFIQIWLGEWIGWFPSFNIADAAITVGAGLLIIDAIFYADRENAKGSEPNSPDP